jgi:hypothetical protein
VTKEQSRSGNMEQILSLLKTSRGVDFSAEINCKHDQILLSFSK